MKVEAGWPMRVRPRAIRWGGATGRISKVVAVAKLAVVIALCAGPASAQLVGPQPGRQTPPTTAQRLADLNDDLRNHARLHDTYLEVAPIGNEETVPLLIERLRLDFGDKEYGPPSGVGTGFDCAQIHLINALEDITNSQQGVYYPKWKAWWDANRSLSQKQWIANGFVARGMHPAVPVDQRFALELIEALGRDRLPQDYRAFNAARALEDVPATERLAWAKIAAASTSGAARLGAIEALEPIDVAGTEDVLRKLSGDADPLIRREALSSLNKHLRERLPTSPTTNHTLRSVRNKGDGISGVFFTGGLFVVAFDSGEVQALDAGTYKTLWTLPSQGQTVGFVVAAADQLILASGDGGMAAVDAGGDIVWKRDQENDDRENRVDRVVANGGEVFVDRGKTIERIDAKSGTTNSWIRGNGLITDVAAGEAGVFFVDDVGLHSASGGALKFQIKGAIAVSVGRDLICVTSSADEEKSSLTCVDASNFRLRWTHSIYKANTSGHQNAAIQDGSNVLLPTDEGLMAFRASDGTQEWDSRGGQEAEGSTIATPHGILIVSEDYRLEMREVESGEVRQVWARPEDGIDRVVAGPHSAVVAGFKNSIWVIDLDE